MSSGLEDFSLFELFRMEAEEQIRLLQDELIHLETDANNAAALETLMRASHSLKGAARIIGLDVIVHLTHAMEDRFVAAQAGDAMTSADVDRMLAATDWLARLQATTEAETAAWLEENTAAIEAFTAGFTPSPQNTAAEPAPPQPAPAPPATPAASAPAPSKPARADEPEEDIFSHRDAQGSTRERTVRIGADRFDQIMSLVSEMLVTSRTLAVQGEALERNRRAIARAQHVLEDDSTTAAARSSALRDIEKQTGSFAAHIAELDQLSRANERTAERLYRTVLSGRLRPFAEGITGIPRLVRDTARDLGKQVHLEVLGETTRVDRDILEKLEAPISHLITNALDHGIESPSDRIAAGKPPEARLRLHGRHENGRLVVTVRDDGGGIHRDRLREHIVHRGFVTADTAATLADNELLEFLFLPGFSTKQEVSTVSGRGVGLNVVQSMVQEAGGSVTVTSEEGVGTVFRLTLPVTRSVLKVIRLQAEGESYAVPLVRIDRVAHLPVSIDNEGLATTDVAGTTIPVKSLGQLLGFTTRPLPAAVTPVLICGNVAFAVDRFIDEVELPVRRLDSRLGKIPGVSAASLDENGLPLLILDVEDLVQTALSHATSAPSPDTASQAPHILVVDDSHTVREMERRLLVRAGYTVTAAQNGQEAWNLLRLNHYDLLISDVDMPQMNGIELVSKVRENPRLARMPIIILSYKNHDEDRRRGLEAGADFYLTKGDFQNDTFRNAVLDLIGPAEPHTAGEA